MQVSSVGGASPQALAAPRPAAPPLAQPVLDVDDQSVTKAQRAVNRSDVLYL